MRAFQLHPSRLNKLQAALREIGAEPIIGSGPAAARGHVVRERARSAPVIAATGLAAR